MQLGQQQGLSPSCRPPAQGLSRQRAEAQGTSPSQRRPALSRLWQTPATSLQGFGAGANLPHGTDTTTPLLSSTRVRPVGPAETKWPPQAWGVEVPALRAQHPETPKHSAADPRYPRRVSVVQGGFPKRAQLRLVPQLQQGLSAVGGHQWPPSQEEALKHLLGIASAMPQLIQRMSPVPFLNSALS